LSKFKDFILSYFSKPAIDPPHFEGLEACCSPTPVSKKEKKDMSTVKKVSADVSTLRYNLKELTTAIHKTTQQINRLADDVHGLKGEMKKFKSDVAKDITTLEKLHTEKG